MHHDSLTCAHRNYPFGTLLRVKNLSNGKEITVKVTDRGPYGRGRIIDLSYGAARALGMLSQGVAMVEVRRVDGLNPPYRMDDEPERGLPDFEFDFSKAAYSFIEDWKDEDGEVDRGMTKEEMMVKNRPHNTGDNDRSDINAQARHPAKSAAAGKTRHRQNAAKEKDPAFWSGVFDRVKNWFGN